MLCIILVMPNRSIYVADADLPLFERAQELARGSLSAAIKEAVQRFVEVKDMQEQGFQEVVVNVGPPGTQLRKRFNGFRLARWEYSTPEGYLQQYSVYRTPKNSLVLYINVVPGPGLQTPMPISGAESRLEVLAGLEELETKVPEDFFLAVRGAFNQPVIEDVEI